MSITPLELPGSIAAGDEDQPTALILDERLRFLSNAATEVHRAVGHGLNRLRQTGGLKRLGFRGVGDYAMHRLGISDREGQELAWLERSIADFPPLDQAWRDGRITRSHVRLLLQADIKPEDADTWARTASRCTVRRLEDRLKAGLGPVAGGSGVVGEADGTWLVCAASPALRFKWELGLELASRLLEHDARPWELVDIAIMELSAGPRLAEGTRWEVPAAWKAWVEECRQRRLESDRELERKLEAETEQWSFLSWEQPQVRLATDVSLPDSDDPWRLDARLVELMRFGRRIDLTLMRHLWLADQASIARCLNFKDLAHYATERLGIGRSRCKAMMTLRARLIQLPDVEDALQSNMVTMTQAELVARIATDKSVDAWIEYATLVATLQLKRDVQRAERLQQEFPGRYGDIMPPSVAPAYSQTCAAVSATTDEASLPDEPVPLIGDGPGFLRLWLPGELITFVHDGIALCREWLGPMAPVSDCIEFLLDGLFTEYADAARTAARDHRIVERDSWRCQVPGCSSRRNLQEHHIVFRSHGGSDEDTNLVTLCAFHHLQGVHEGWLSVSGEAPGRLLWRLGIRPGGRALETFEGTLRAHP